MDVVFQCSGEDFYNALTTPEVYSVINITNSWTNCKLFNFNF